jgi:hypothetical protein
MMKRKIRDLRIMIFLLLLKMRSKSWNHLRIWSYLIIFSLIWNHSTHTKLFADFFIVEWIEWKTNRRWKKLCFIWWVIYEIYHVWDFMNKGIIRLLN